MKRLLTLTIALIVMMVFAPSIQSQSKITRTTKTTTQQSTSKKTTGRTGKSTGVAKSKTSVSPPVKQSETVVIPEESQSSAVEKQVEAVTPKEEPSEPDGYINGHAYVDLGLSSGLKWATCNVGSDKPEASYRYYAWGDTAPKSEYFIDNGGAYKKSYSKLESEGIIGLEGHLTPSYDAASSNMGGSWRMPTKNELEELKDECKWKSIKLKGNPGYLITGPNGKSIFLPKAGYRQFNYKREVGSKAHYWSSTPCEDDWNSYTSEDVNYIGGHSRFEGCAVRAVSE